MRWILRSHAGSLLAAFVALILSLAQAQAAADRDRIVEFLRITGFDVAIDSIAQSAESAPGILGLEDDAFGQSWTRLSEQVFVPAEMRNRALDILEETLTDDLLDHAIGFYGSALGQRFVTAENSAYEDDDELKQIAGERIVAAMVAAGDPRLEYYKRMNRAVDPDDIGVTVVQEIQLRFLLAASHAGVIDRRLDEEMLRAQLAETEAQLRLALEVSALQGAAFTYQGFDEAELKQYVDALEEPEMRQVYELLNAVHYQIMGARFDQLARRLGDLQPSEEL